MSILKLQTCNKCGKYTTEWQWIKGSLGYYWAICNDCYKEKENN